MSERDVDIGLLKNRLDAAEHELKAARREMEALGHKIKLKCPHKENPKPGDIFYWDVGKGLYYMKMKDSDFVVLDTPSHAYAEQGDILNHKDTTYIGNIKDKLHLLLLDEDKLAAALRGPCGIPIRTCSYTKRARQILDYLESNQ